MAKLQYFLIILTDDEMPDYPQIDIARGLNEESVCNTYVKQQGFTWNTLERNGCSLFAIPISQFNLQYIKPLKPKPNE